MTDLPTPPATMRQIQSLVTDDGTLRVALVEVDTPTPRPDDVVVRIDATPINPSDLGLLLAGADLSTAERSGTDDLPVVTATLSAAAAAAQAGRVGQSLPVGNEGAGTVVAAGSSEAAQALLGKTVAVLGGAMYAEYRCLPASACLVLPDGTDPRDGASCFVNPLTALGMTETMRLEGHTALVHTAAASNLGQMLNRICIADGISLVNVVRRPEQAELLRSQGATYVVDSSLPSFDDDLVAAITATGATIGFDATGGGRLAGQLLAAMEKAAVANQTEGFSRYGSTVFKQVYIYGGLDRSPTELQRNFGMAWGLGGWLLTPFLIRIGTEAADALRARVVSELQTTFASTYTAELSLVDVLDLDHMQTYARQATGEKALIRPSR